MSPADGKILSFSEVNSDSCLLIKGKIYSLGELLTGIKDHKFSNEGLNQMKRNPKNKLYQCVFYLNPGDYHRFHSPTDMIMKVRNHIVGYLLPVKESYLLECDVINNKIQIYLYYQGVLIREKHYMVKSIFSIIFNIESL